MAEESEHSIRLMNFVSEEKLDQAKRARGERVEDGTAQRDRPLYEILKENKDKRDAEFNERFKHRPPKALDEDETEFLDNFEMSKRVYEQQVHDEEAEQLRSFQAAVAAQSTVVHELKEAQPAVQEPKIAGKKTAPTRPLSMIIKVKPQAKKPRLDQAIPEEPLDVVTAPALVAEPTPILVKVQNGDANESHGITGLVSYSDESEDDD